MYRDIARRITVSMTEERCGRGKRRRLVFDDEWVNVEGISEEATELGEGVEEDIESRVAVWGRGRWRAAHPTPDYFADASPPHAQDITSPPSPYVFPMCGPVSSPPPGPGSASRPRLFCLYCPTAWCRGCPDRLTGCPRLHLTPLAARIPHARPRFVTAAQGRRRILPPLPHDALGTWTTRRAAQGFISPPRRPEPPHAAPFCRRHPGQAAHPAPPNYFVCLPRKAGLRPRADNVEGVFLRAQLHGARTGPRFERQVGVGRGGRRGAGGGDAISMGDRVRGYEGRGAVG
ncbi:hypothetical protein B0H14DRAFT_3426046 [Mycena olivaceomarginata]|nr:hypothetical protein B0H14DRAFT_3426046 [Mycena olivaceomarginata]